MTRDHRVLGIIDCGFLFPIFVTLSVVWAPPRVTLYLNCQCGLVHGYRLCRAEGNCRADHQEGAGPHMCIFLVAIKSQSLSGESVLVIIENSRDYVRQLTRCENILQGYSILTDQLIPDHPDHDGQNG